MSLIRINVKWTEQARRKEQEQAALVEREQNEHEADVILLGQAFSISFRRSEMEHAILKEQLHAYLTCTHELREYMLYLQSYPNRLACLCAPSCPESLQEAVLAGAKREWAIVQQLESGAESLKVLNTHCLHVKFQCYRELMCVLERENFRFTDLVQTTISSWFPSFSQSSNLESIFREMEAAVKKGGAPQDSLANLSCVAVRALERRICCGPESAQTLTLGDSDWHGKSVRGLKERLWNPSSAIPRILA